MTKTFQLLHSPSCLFVWIISCTDSPHTCWFVSCITLRAIIEVGVWSTGTVYTNIPSHSDMRTPMWFAHYSDNSNLLKMPEIRMSGFDLKMTDAHTTSSSDWSGLQFWQQRLLIIIWNRTDDIYKPRYPSEPKLLAHFCSEFVEGNRLVGIMGLNEFSCNTCSDS